MSNEVKEIDLLDLFYKIAFFLKSNITPIIISVFIGSALGIGYYYASQNKYEQIVICYSPVVSSEILIESIDDINNVSYLNLLTSSDSVIKQALSNVHSISTTKLTDAGKDMVKVIFVSSLPISKDITTGIIESCIQNNDYIKNKVEVRKENLVNIISFLDSEITNKKVDSNLYANSTGDIYINNNETAATLYIQKKKYEEELAFIQPIVITKALGISKSIKPSIIIHVFVGAFIGLVLIILTILIKRLFGLDSKSFDLKASFLVQSKSA